MMYYILCIYIYIIIITYIYTYIHVYSIFMTSFANTWRLNVICGLKRIAKKSFFKNPKALEAPGGKHRIRSTKVQGIHEQKSNHPHFSGREILS